MEKDRVRKAAQRKKQRERERRASELKREWERECKRQQRAKKKSQKLVTEEEMCQPTPSGHSKPFSSAASLGKAV